MVKFVELFNYIGMLDDMTTCTCCGRQSERVAVYKVKEKMVCLCDHCREFLEEVLE